MKRIVNRKRYDTETAQELAHYWNRLDSSDDRSVSEGLYKTKSGAYFLVGEGGALSEYAEVSRDGTCGGAELIPMSPDEALEWLERRDKPDVIEREFPDKIIDA